MPVEIDIRARASFVFFGRNGTVVEEVSFINLDIETIHRVLRDRGFLPTKK